MSWPCTCGKNLTFQKHPATGGVQTLLDLTVWKYDVEYDGGVKSESVRGKSGFTVPPTREEAHKGCWRRGSLVQCDM